MFKKQAFEKNFQKWRSFFVRLFSIKKKEVCLIFRSLSQLKRHTRVRKLPFKSEAPNLHFFPLPQRWKVNVWGTIFEYFLLLKELREIRNFSKKLIFQKNTLLAITMTRGGPLNYFSRTLAIPGNWLSVRARSEEVSSNLRAAQIRTGG